MHNNETINTELVIPYTGDCMFTCVFSSGVEKPFSDVKDEMESIVFSNMTSTDVELVTLQTKLNVPPGHGYSDVNKVLQCFTQHCDINQSSWFCQIIGENCITVFFQVPTATLPVLEKKINDSAKSLADMKVSLVKILGKTVFETNSDQNTLLKVLWNELY